MKKKVGIGVALVVFVLIVGLGLIKLNASSQSTILSTEDIRQIIQSQYPGEITALQLSENASDSVYEAVVKNGENEYVIKLDGKSGEILNLKQEIAGGDEMAKSEDDALEDTNAEDNTNTDLAEEDKGNAIINLDKVKEIALEQFQGTIEEVNLDEDDGRKIYEINIVNGEDEAEIEIDAYTAEIIVVDIDIEIDDEEDDD
ncbi:PepSY domain-containing protein [Oceanobacillus bengalensis]|uniref:PepSY domain-containing protein n=1 Tax=Oceanobacillus bengalensis TaxID=1435466 RepID=UPI001603BFB7|nr:PepSY domain-containing protein [Oceanobacillus bengalensis]